MCQLPLNLATRSIVGFAHDISEWLQGEPEILERFMRAYIQKLNPELDLEAYQESNPLHYMEVMQSAIDGLETTRKTAEAIQILFPMEQGIQIQGTATIEVNGDDIPE